MLTKLSAINIILDSIGESPVNSLASGLSDAETAARVLDEVVDDVMDIGWNFNTEREFKVTPDTNGFIALPMGALRVDPSGSSAALAIVPRSVDGVVRMYDLKNQTFVFTSPVYLDVVISYAFDDLPHAFKRFAAHRAAGEFQQREMGSETLDRFLEMKIKESWENLMDFDAKSEDANVLRDSQSVVDITWRRNVLRSER